MRGRLSTLAAAMIVARRDFTAILLSRSFIFFLLGPLFTMLIGGLAGGIGQSVQREAIRMEIGVAMPAPEAARMIAARAALDPALGRSLPPFVAVDAPPPGQRLDPATAFRGRDSAIAAIVAGTPEAPELVGPESRIGFWQGPVSLVAARATGKGPDTLPAVALSAVASSGASQKQDRAMTAQAGQVVLLLLTMLLAGMVLSNLVEEKANKVIEVLAAAIPMDAVFFGKLFAMLGVSFVGIAVWFAAGSAIGLAAGHALPALAAPAVGWPLFLLLGVVYFSMGYLLIGSVFLAIGSMAATVRDVQTLSLPATLLQLVVFFIASYALARPGSPMEIAACVFPFSSPFAMLARAAQDGAVWPHLVAFGWQVLCVALLVRGGARLFRRRVMQSGPGAAGGTRRGWLRRA